jgi:4-amino-4-deoxy-L-arabinose transferase-like glycosyltransferase
LTVWLGLLPAIAFAGAAGLIVVRRPGVGLRASIIVATVLAGLWLVLGTELLSFAGALRPGPVRVWWAIPAVAALAALARERGALRRALAAPPAPSAWCAPLLLAVVVLVALAFLSALLAPPTNPDSLTYHLSRIVFWLQHGTVDHYSTNDVRQLMMQPFAEYAGAHLLALSGGSDRLLGLTQCFALVVTLAATSLLTERLGGETIAQWFACLFVISWPIVFMQASSTKNDVVAGMWLTVSAWLALRWWDEAPTFRAAVLLGGAIGACALTKGTGVLFVVPVVAAAAAGAVRTSAWRAFAPLAVIALVALSLNAPFAVRNLRQFGRPLGPAGSREGGFDLVNERRNLRTVVSNATRTLAQEAALGDERYNALLRGAVEALHERVLGVPVNDPATTTPHSTFGTVRFWPEHEDLAGAPAHLLLLLLTPIALFLRRPSGEHGRRLLLVLGIAGGGFVLLCLALKWQEWNVRFVASLAGVLAPAVAAVVPTAHRSGKAAVLAASALLCIGVVPAVRSNPRTLFTEDSVLRRDRAVVRFWYLGYEEATRAAGEVASAAELAFSRHAAVVGFVTPRHYPDYLFLRAILDRVPWTPAFEYVNPSVAVPGTPHSRADLVIAPSSTSSLTDGATGARYRLAQDYAWFTVLVPDLETQTSAQGTPAALAR